ncbi:MAG TPA: chitinase [Blastocatellia bacterium]|nr:chitinase [Blastocatellia bacterium]
MKRARIVAVVLAVPVLGSFLPPPRAQNVPSNRQAPVRGSTVKPASGKAALLIGYWHNFVNAAGSLQLGSVSPQFDVINVAFARPISGSTSTIDFTVGSFESKAQFTADVAALHQAGKKVMLSIGGANTLVQLNSATDLQNFVNSVSSIVNQFGFDGIDIDFEINSITLEQGDVDFRNPTTPAIVNLILALHQLKSTLGGGFVISMAPETFGVQAGFRGYSGQQGAYLPVIFAARDILSYIHVQGYNSGRQFGLDGNVYAQGTADFHVAMTEMLLQGFPVAGDSAKIFPPLPSAQVAFGVPASASAAGGGFTSNTDLENAINYLVKGTAFGGQYKLVNPAGYPGLRGMMTWSINWDAANGFALSNSIGPFLHSLGTIQSPSISNVTAVHKNLVVTGSGFDIGAVITVDGRDQRTANDDANPATSLIGIKTIKRAGIAPGDMVTIQVRNSNGSLSNQLPYTRPS